MARTFYAIAYAYGRAVVNGGNRPDLVYRFETLAARQQFLACPPHEGDVDAASASDPLVRKALRYAAQLGDVWPVAV